MTSKHQSEYWQNLNEDMAEFRAAHRLESKSAYNYVPARLITLPGLVLYELERRGMIESNGGHSYRPKIKAR